MHLRVDPPTPPHAQAFSPSTGGGPIAPFVGTLNARSGLPDGSRSRSRSC